MRASELVDIEVVDTARESNHNVRHVESHERPPKSVSCGVWFGEDIGLVTEHVKLVDQDDGILRKGKLTEVVHGDVVDHVVAGLHFHLGTDAVGVVILIEQLEGQEVVGRDDKDAPVLAEHLLTVPGDLSNDEGLAEARGDVEDEAELVVVDDVEGELDEFLLPILREQRTDRPLGVLGFLELGLIEQPFIQFMLGYEVFDDTVELGRDLCRDLPVFKLDGGQHVIDLGNVPALPELHLLLFGLPLGSSKSFSDPGEHAVEGMSGHVRSVLDELREPVLMVRVRHGVGDLVHEVDIPVDV